MTTDGTANIRPRRRLALFIIVPVLALLTLLSWGLSSAVGSTPDDDFHLASIWCGHGDNEDGGCSPAPDSSERTISRDLMIDSVCFAFNADASASCQGADFGDNPTETIVTDRGNFEGLYPPVYYFAMSLFAGADIESSVLVMKTVNSVLFVGLVSALFFLLPTHRRPTLVWSLALSLVPLGLFLIPSTNPSGWAILSAGTLWLAVLGYFESTGRRRVALAAVAAVVTIIGAGARADGALYAGLAIAIVIVLTAERSKNYWLSAIFPVSLMVVAGLFYLAAGQTDAATSGLGEVDDEATPVSPFVLTALNLINVPSLWAGALGAGNLGWLDTPIPVGVSVLILAVFAGAMFIGLGTSFRRKGVAALLVLVVMWLLPTFVLVQTRALVGAYYQPRYILPLLVLLAGIILLQSTEAPVVVNRAQIALVVLALSLGNAAALHTNIRRYVTGLDESNVNLDSHIEWWWNIPISPMTVWAIGSLAFAGVLVAISSRLWNSQQRDLIAAG